jgi:hypothetical protein
MFVPAVWLLDWIDIPESAAAWPYVLIPATLCGVVGSVLAYRRRRIPARWLGGVSIGAGLVFGIWLFGALMEAPHQWRSARLIRLWWLAALPLAAGAWALLLSVLVPPKPQPLEAPDQRPSLAP